MAARLGYLLQLEDFVNEIIEGDSQVIILSLQHPHSSLDWHISSFIYDIINSLPVFISWSGRKVKRCTNFYTHLVAH
jgi:hypothetical protein